jgi:GNAT superfamily N-acetyltransferase
MRVRPARASDLEAIVAFTERTFEWGDYVPDCFEEWLGEDDSAVMVAVDDTDTPIGLARVVMMSDREAWVHAARVHPDHRRKGVGSAVNDALCGWASDRGAIVARLLTEDWNEAAQGQVAASGYRRVSTWSWPSRDLGSGTIDPVTNGGRRVPGEEQLASGSRAEIDPAWIAWSSSEMAFVGRTMYPLGWTFRRMTIDDVHRASRTRELLQCASGWVIASTDDDTLRVSWVVTNEMDAPKLARAVIDLAARRRLESVMVMMPAVAWLESAFEHAGCRPRRGYLWAKELPT